MKEEFLLRQLPHHDGQYTGFSITNAMKEITRWTLRAKWFTAKKSSTSHWKFNFSYTGKGSRVFLATWPLVKGLLTREPLQSNKHPPRSVPHGAALPARPIENTQKTYTSSLLGHTDTNMCHMLLCKWTCELQRAWKEVKAEQKQHCMTPHCNCQSAFRQPHATPTVMTALFAIACGCHPSIHPLPGSVEPPSNIHRCHSWQ